MIFALPLWLLTKPVGEIPDIRQENKTNKQNHVSGVLSIKMSAKPLELKIFQGDRIVAEYGKEEMDDYSGEEEVDFSLSDNKKISLRVESKWAETAEHAITLIIEPDRMPAKSDTKWVSGNNMNDLFSFTWE